MVSKLIDWFLYNCNIEHERVVLTFFKTKRLGLSNKPTQS